MFLYINDSFIWSRSERICECFLSVSPYFLSSGFRVSLYVTQILHFRTMGKNYMARFARRAADIVRMEKEEVRAAAASKAASIATSAALTPPTTATVQAERVYTGDTTTAV